jgi:hypothetical protein
MKVFGNGAQIEAFELLGVIKRLAHRIGPQTVMVQNLKIQVVGPPVAIRSARAFTTMRHGAFAGL